jgi:hypothetical protein
MAGTRPIAWLAAAICAACGGATQQAQQSNGSPPAPRLQSPATGSLYHGVFPAGTDQPDSDISPANLAGYEQTVGRRVAWVYLDNDWFRSRAFPAVTTGWIHAHGAVPFIRLMLRSQRRPLVTDPVFTLDRINAGAFDADLSAWADAAKAYGDPLIVEYGTEINGDWNPWSAPYNGGLDIGPVKFKQAYRHIVQLMRSRGATNITWALHYYGQNFPGDDPRNVPSTYYPGDDVVDWVGISAYGSEKPYDHRCPTLRQLVDDMLPQLRAATPNKPLFLFELGITDHNPGCPSGPWIHAAFTDLLGGRWPEIRGFAWWNEHWSTDANPADDSQMLVQENHAVGDEFHAALTGPQAGEIIDAPLLK